MLRAELGLLFGRDRCLVDPTAGSRARSAYRNARRPAARTRCAATACCCCRRGYRGRAGRRARRGRAAGAPAPTPTAVSRLGLNALDSGLRRRRQQSGPADRAGPARTAGTARTGEIAAAVSLDPVWIQALGQCATAGFRECSRRPSDAAGCRRIPGCAATARGRARP